MGDYMLKVSRRGGYSDRNGINPINTEIQLNKLDERTRNQIYNTILNLYSIIYEGYGKYSAEKQNFAKYVLREIYSQPLKVGGYYDEKGIFDYIEETILEDSYSSVLTLVEAVAQYWDKCLYDRKSSSGKYFPVIYKCFNDVFEREYVGYRFIDRIISPISDDVEIETINETLKKPYDAVYEHIAKANRLLSNREKPDYENSIKESITALEAICQKLTGIYGGKATLGDMLNRLEDNGIEIHGALKNAYRSLYGYTSDANGIRHAGNIGGPSATFEEAKYMLVSCCAFINYLIGVYSKCYK